MIRLYSILKHALGFRKCYLCGDSQHLFSGPIFSKVNNHLFCGDCSHEMLISMGNFALAVFDECIIEQGD